MTREFFNIPLLIYPEMSKEELEHECKKLWDRTVAIRQWEEGQLSTSDFLDMLDSQSYDVFDFAQNWIDGNSAAL